MPIPTLSRLKPVALAMALAATLPAAAPAHAGWDFDLGGVVYVMTNAAEGNKILSFARNRQGQLQPLPLATVATGGKGGSTNAPVDPLGSQDALIYNKELKMLFAVNAGDNSVSAFNAGTPGLRPQRTALVNSGGFIPVSLAVSGDKLYVLNAGGSGTVVTFGIGPKGQLTQLARLNLGLSYPEQIPFNNALAPGQVGVDTLGRRLIVTHGGGKEILSSSLDDDGLPVGALVSTPSPGIVPFAFGTTRHGSVLVAEAGSGAVSAYDSPTGDVPLQLTSASVADGQRATCWIVVGDAGYAYVSNTGSSNLSQYHYTRTGQLEVVNPVAASTGAAPIDLTFANGGAFLYTLNAAAGSISGFRVDPADGHLDAVETQGGLPANKGLQGIAARDF